MNNDWERDTKTYHKLVAPGKTMCKRTIVGRFVTDEDTLLVMDEAGYAFMCKDCKATIAKERDNEHRNVEMRTTAN